MTEPSTPRLSHHARERCGEMGISTKRAKRIVLNADVRRPSRELMVATCDSDSELAVVYEDSDPPVIVSVVFRTEDEYVREGQSYRTVHRGKHMVD